MIQAKELWTTEETATLIRLLEKVKADNGWWPNEECMRAAHGTMSAWAPELVFWGAHYHFPRDSILLTTYDGGIEEYRGRWHIPGGYGSVKDVSFEAACSRVSLAEVGVDVIARETLGLPYMWHPGEHPYGRPLSVFTLVLARGIIQETDTRRFFGRHELPDNLITPHRRFAEQFIASDGFVE